MVTRYLTSLRVVRRAVGSLPGVAVQGGIALGLVPSLCWGGVAADVPAAGSPAVLLAEFSFWQIAALAVAGIVLLGAVIGSICVAWRNVGRASQAETALRRQEATAQNYLDIAGVAMVSLDIKGRITLLNRRGHEILGYANGELIGRDWFATCVPPDIRATVRQVFKQLMAGEIEAAEHFENSVLTKSGETRTIAWHNTTLTDPTGRIAGVLCSGEDVTERKRIEKEREELIAKLESQNAELERFTYTVSHDLKSPLITIKGYLGLAGEDLRAGDADAVMDSLGRMTRAAERMERLLIELLELSRVGRMVQPSEDVSIEELAREAIELTTGRLAPRGVTVDIAPDLPIVHVDRQRFVEVFQNLIDNAAKFMGDQADPRIEITAATEGGEVVCSVRDNGVGVDPRYHERIFGLFNKLSRDTEGSGVGLAMVRRIVQVHGGRAWVESEGERHGSTFKFAIPCQKTAPCDERVLA